MGNDFTKVGMRGLFNVVRHGISRAETNNIGQESFVETFEKGSNGAHLVVGHASRQLLPEEIFIFDQS